MPAKNKKGMRAGATGASRLVIAIVGGHASKIGGLELFARRAAACLRENSPAAVTEIPTSTAEVPLCRLPALLGRVWRFRRALPRHGIVWLQYGNIRDLLFLIAAKSKDRTTAVTLHLGGGWRSQRNSLLKFLSDLLLGAADRIFLLYPAQADDLRLPPRLRERCLVLPTLLPKEVLQNAPPRRSDGKPPHLLHAARMSAEKGSLAFVEVCARLNASGIAFEAEMIGSADERFGAHLREAIRRAGLMDKIAITPFMPPEELIGHLRQCDFLVHLSLQDAYPLIVLEALGCGAIPVCTALPGTRDMAKEFPAVLLVEGQDAQAASERITGAAERQEGTAARLRKKYDWPAVANRYKAVFETLQR